MRGVGRDHRGVVDADADVARGHVRRQVQTVGARLAAGRRAADGGQLALRLRELRVRGASPAPRGVALVPGVQVHAGDTCRGEVPHGDVRARDGVAREDAGGIGRELEKLARWLRLQLPDRAAHRAFATGALTRTRGRRQPLVRRRRLIERTPAQEPEHLCAVVPG